MHYKNQAFSDFYHSLYNYKVCNINPVSWWGNDGFLSHMAQVSFQPYTKDKNLSGFPSIFPLFSKKDCCAINFQNWNDLQNLDGKSR